jgi:hypothetical protein
MRVACATFAAVLFFVGAPRTDAAEWQFKPFVGATYGSDTTFVLVQQGTARPHTTLGINGMLLGEIFGLEADFGHTSGFFQDVDSAQPLVTDSGVTTLTGNVVVALPRRLAQYTLRPYIVGGAGMMHVRVDLNGGLQNVSNLQAMDLGAGVTGFLTRRVGVSWDVRYFRSVDRTRENGFSITSEHLSFWRASMALAFRV